MNNNKQSILIVENDEKAREFLTDLRFWGMDKQVSFYSPKLRGFYDNIIDSYSGIANKIRFYNEIKSESKSLVITTPESFLLKFAPKSFFEKNSMHLEVGQDLPMNFLERLVELGYLANDQVEESLYFADRGGIIDIFPSHLEKPVRIELFDREIETIRSYDPNTQRSFDNRNSVEVMPARECLLEYVDLENLIKLWKEDCLKEGINFTDKEEFVSKLVRKKYFTGLDQLLPYFHESFETFYDLISDKDVFIWDLGDCQKNLDHIYQDLKSGYQNTPENEIKVKPESAFLYDDKINTEKFTSKVFNSLEIIDDGYQADNKYQFQARVLHKVATMKPESNPVVELIEREKLQDQKVVLSLNNATQRERIRAALLNTKYQLFDIVDALEDLSMVLDGQDTNKQLIHVVQKPIVSSANLSDLSISFLSSELLFGRTLKSKAKQSFKSIEDISGIDKFSDLNPGDKIVHLQHGVGTYDGLTTISLDGSSSEFIQLVYKDGDKLFVPVYSISLLQKYSGTNPIDRLGSNSWEKSKIKVKNSLKDIADELLQLYSKRTKIKRTPYSAPNEEYFGFEDKFPFTETEDQLNSIKDIMTDLQSDQPMDRLVCGDVGFGKTEIAMRAAFKVIQSNKLVAVLVPTTVLSFQHLENFKRRFKHWPVQIEGISRFTSKSEVKRIIADLNAGRVDLIIGTHRLLSKDIELKNIGLVVVDEEQRFGVVHKEKLKQLKTNIDTLTLTATPIPRTLNMSLVGMRDLSVINTPPLDRLPTRTFVNRFSKPTIEKAISSEVQRGGQIYFLHNRVQSIYARANEIQELLPDVKMKIAHGQMPEGELEKVMLSFFKNEFQVLICTSIIESGVDNPNANTMIIDNAQQLGLSQLYQIRGRVGRSKERAYCYLMIPQNLKLEREAQDRLKIIQENTALGSGFKIAHHDLELRGAGSILGDEQSGHVNVVGYELYLELLEEALNHAKGIDVETEIEPEINLRIPALIPDKYISDIRTRLKYYKKLSEITGPQDLEDIEDELVDQFGTCPDELIQLMGVMLIRKKCKEIGITDISAGKVNLSISFSETAKINHDKLLKKVVQENKKYRLTPENKFVVRLEDMEWAKVLKEIEDIT
ncbi:MAG: transcription-repair coupling factor [Bdellovibrionales bacterium]